MSKVAALKEMTTYPKVCLDDPKVSATKGTYILVVELDAEQRIHVGSLGVIQFPRACYAYLGSALGGFKSRVKHHLSKDKKQKWHIDYLLSEAKVLQIILCETERRLECLLSGALANELSFVPSFGSSDCSCRSHLYFASDRAYLELGIRSAITEVALPREPFKEMLGF